MTDDAQTPPLPQPDTRDWTVVLEKPCPECGFDAASVPPEALAGQLEKLLPRWVTALEDRDAARRPRALVWSPVEYARHVADVCEVMTGRLRLILDGAGTAVAFPGWDADEAALESEYWQTSAEAATLLLRERLGAAARAWAEPAGGQWAWEGVRGDGVTFTVASLGRYFLHEVVHHLQDATR